MRYAKTASLLAFALLLSNCRAAVRTGLDNVGSHSRLFQGKRIGIITNHTGYGSDGKFIVDILRRMPAVRVTALFGPEHGFHGVEQAGKRIDSDTHPIYKVPIYSLYGKTRKPTPEMLADVDVLVFDIQDIGARFYTYIYTMSLAMEAAGESGKRFVVLDRPNPITGNCVEGNILEPEFASFVGLYPIPARHGMTVGELATMFNEEGWLAGVKADLVVVPITGWRRSMWHNRTGLRFIKPSPNMPDLETAIVYPGLCLLEGTNVSEGRGTDMPFRRFGAPWIERQTLAARLNALRLPGVRFEPASFTPTASKFQGRRCHGVKIAVTDRDMLRPYWTGIRIVNEIRRLYPSEFEWRASHFDRLCGTSRIRLAISNRSSLEELRQSWGPAIESFTQIRKKYLLYPE
ncbi:MAG: DUF1343 domain-containing protein [Phycisphaerales bacterium]|nr:MAG: DUF1343 domain-containing protein [Phycisphaerales bacterium]